MGSLDLENLCNRLINVIFILYVIRSFLFSDKGIFKLWVFFIVWKDVCIRVK